EWQAAWDLSAAALALAPDEPDALAAHGLAALQLGAPRECQRDLEARLACDPPDARRGELLVALARALEGTNQLEAALARHAEALAWDPADEDAHAGRLRVLERLGRRADAASALAEWAAHTSEASLRAERLVRAARTARPDDPADARGAAGPRGAPALGSAPAR